MSTNKNLVSAKVSKKDEFYTLYADIEKEVKNYDLRGMSVYSPCDDYRFSNFKKYFVEHFHELGLTKYCCTNYDIGDGAYKYVYDGVSETISPLIGNGDFESEECTAIRDEYDCIITNPPFSLFRKFFNWIADGKETTKE